MYIYIYIYMYVYIYICIYICIYIRTFLGLFHGEQLKGMQNYMESLQNTSGTISKWDKNLQK